jgi:hypothetical protein
MSEVKHTSKPWTYGVRRDGSIWLSLGDHKTPGMAHYQGDLCATQADARLICAAPDLLNALRQCAAVVAGDTMHKQGLIDALVAARDAIAKAEGGSHG